MAKDLTDPFAADDDQTPLNDEERAGLILSHITLRGQLNEAEQANILGAEQWAFSRRHRGLISESFVRRLHKQMFGEVWQWAGNFRTSEKNFGVPYYTIRAELRHLVGDATAWIKHESYPPDEIALRFKHRIVSIHCFANGNGRHSRMLADLVAIQLGRERFSWGRDDLMRANDTRRAYIDALHAADGHNLEPLVAFARS